MWGICGFEKGDKVGDGVGGIGGIEGGKERDDGGVLGNGEGD